MILTCPACDTKYVVKDGAIPPGGRQVRCASCKHSWHQDPEQTVADPATAVDMEPGDPSTVSSAGSMADDLPQAEAEGTIVAESQAELEAAEESPWGAVSEEPAGGIDPAAVEPAADVVSTEEAPAITEEWPAGDRAGDAAAQAAEDEFIGYAPIGGDEERPKRRWLMILAILVLIAAGAAAFWFLAPAEWKARAGIAEAGYTPLQLMITTSDRQPLQSGNELVAISGRVINPTDREQQIPPIRAELRDGQTKKVVHRWTIPAPARVLAPRSSANFNSAEVNVPSGGDELTVTLGG